MQAPIPGVASKGSGGQKAVPLFTIYLMPGETPVRMPKNTAAWCIEASASRGVVKRALELGRKAVSLYQS